MWMPAMPGMPRVTTLAILAALVGAEVLPDAVVKSPSTVAHELSEQGTEKFEDITGAVKAVIRKSIEMSLAVVVLFAVFYELLQGVVRTIGFIAFLMWCYLKLTEQKKTTHEDEKQRVIDEPEVVNEAWVLVEDEDEPEAEPDAVVEAEPEAEVEAEHETEPKAAVEEEDNEWNMVDKIPVVPKEEDSIDAFQNMRTRR